MLFFLNLTSIYHDPAVTLAEAFLLTSARHCPLYDEGICREDRAEDHDTMFDSVLGGIADLPLTSCGTDARRLA